MKIRAEFTGGRELASALKTLPTRVSKRIVREALADAADPIRDHAEQNAPVQAGGERHLRDEILVMTGRVPDVTASVVVGPSKGTFYGGFLEFGTIHIPAHAWFRPAWDAEHQGSLAMIARNLWIALAAKGIGRTVRDTSGPVVGGPGGGLR